jgi:hypothetical protein
VTGFAAWMYPQVRTYVLLLLQPLPTVFVGTAKKKNLENCQNLRNQNPSHQRYTLHLMIAPSKIKTNAILST